MTDWSPEVQARLEHGVEASPDSPTWRAVGAVLREVERLSEQLRLCEVPDGWETWRRNAEAEIAELQRSYDFMCGEAHKREQAEAKLAEALTLLRRVEIEGSEEITTAHAARRDAEARLAKVVEILLENRRSANQCLDEPDHPAWVHAQAHATVSVCETALIAAQPKEEP